MEILYYILLFVGGFFAGLYGSVVGSGGLISLPLIIFTGIPIHSAIASNRMGVVLLEFSSAVKFYKETKFDYKLGVLFGVLASVGSYIGSNVVINIDEKYLNIITASSLVGVFFILSVKSKLGITKIKLQNKHWFIAMFLVILLGVYGGVSGVGFGTFITFIFLLIGLDFTNSAALSRITGFIMSLTAAIVFAVNGLIHYPYGISLGLGFALGAWMGVGYGIKKGNVYIKYLFITILMISILKLIYDIL